MTGLFPKKVTFCLAMIVKDEAHVIERCLESCRGVVDYVRIIDTGSTDNTLDLIHSWCEKAGVNVKTFSRPWVDFAHNRNEVLEFAGSCPASHLILIDADEILHITPKDLIDIKQRLSISKKVLFSIPMVNGEFISARTNLVRNLPNRLKYHYPMHEELWLDECSTPDMTVIANASDYTKGPHVTTPQDGARSKNGAAKLAGDLATLSSAWLQDKDPRHLFYMGQIMRVFVPAENQDDHWRNVLETYERYIREMGDTPCQFLYTAWIWVARVKGHLNHDGKDVVDAYLSAYRIDPLRPEALGGAAAYCADHGEYEMARSFATRTASCKGSVHHSFLETKWWGIARDILSYLGSLQGVA